MNVRAAEIRNMAGGGNMPFVVAEVDYKQL